MRFSLKAYQLWNMLWLLSEVCSSLLYIVWELPWAFNLQYDIMNLFSLLNVCVNVCCVSMNIYNGASSCTHKACKILHTLCVYRTILTLHVCLIGQMADCHHVVKMHGAAFIGLWKCYRFLSCSGLHQVSTALFFYPKKRLMIISCAANWNWVLSAFSHHDCFCFFHKRKFLSLSLTCAHSLTGATHFLVGKLS